MKKNSIKFITSFVIILMLILTAIPFASAATFLDTDQKVSFTMNCSTPGYTFNVYKVASLDSTSKNPYETKYTSLISTVTSSTVSQDIKDGNTVGLLADLDKIDVSKLTNKVGAFGPTSATVTTMTLSNLEQGVYYVKAVNYPAGVKEVRNSVFALPYYKDNTDGWTYSIDSIPLATKVEDEDITTHKTITNSTKNNENFTDVNLGDTVNFEIKSTVTGEKAHEITTPAGDKYWVEDFKLNSYYVTDDMTNGLTLNKNSFKVRLLKEDGTEIKTLNGSGSSPDYTVKYDTGFDGTDITKNTKFTVALTKEYLQKDEFYEDEVFYTSITYSAVLNTEAVVGPKGNPNTEGKISYSNKNDVVQEHEGNTVYVYTYAITNNKVDENNQPLAGAEFKLFRTEANAQSLKNSIATGVSDANGKVVYLNSKGEEITLQSGIYWVVETKAPEGYNLYGKVIKVDLSATYNDTLTNGTYVKTCPENGIATFSTPNTKIISPKTGGNGNGIFYILSIICGAALLVVVITGITLSIKNKKRKNQ